MFTRLLLHYIKNNPYLQKCGRGKEWHPHICIPSRPSMAVLIFNKIFNEHKLVVWEWEHSKGHFYLMSRVCFFKVWFENNRICKNLQSIPPFSKVKTGEFSANFCRGDFLTSSHYAAGVFEWIVSYFVLSRTN